MTSGLMTLLGGIGLFLFGMHTMTEGLRQLASSRARMALARFTRTSLSGAVTGAITTAAVQSSSATIVTAVGFVGAGLLTFTQALGIIFGASVGTTITGWMVLFLGIRLSLSAAALPFLFVAALVRVLSQGQAGRVAMAVAGLCLVFLGIDLMQEGLADYEGRITPASFPPGGWDGRLQLVGIGLLVTMVTQSSSAGVAGTLVLLASGAVTFEQAAALVIGMHMGTSFTPLLAAIGGSVPVRQTALANVLYHVASGVLAILLLDPAAALVGNDRTGLSAQLGLVMFHTGFNLIGTLGMLPLAGAFAAAVVWLVPEKPGARLSAPLDPSLLREPGAALDTATRVVDDVMLELFDALLTALAEPSPPPGGLEAARQRTGPVIDELQGYLSRLQVAPDRMDELVRLDALLQRVDHLRRLHYRCSQGARIRALARQQRLHWHLRLFRGILRRAIAQPQQAADLAARLARLDGRLAVIEARSRHTVLRRAPWVMNLTAAEVFRLADALRWLRRSLVHVARGLHYRDAGAGVARVAEALRDAGGGTALPEEPAAPPTAETKT